METLLEFLKPKIDLDSFFNVDDLVQNMFDESKVQTLATHGGDDYQGTIRAIFKFCGKEKYFYIKESYGSCSYCDEWIDTNDFETIKRILKDVVIVETLENILPDEKYEPPEWKSAVTALVMV